MVRPSGLALSPFCQTDTPGSGPTPAAYDCFGCRQCKTRKLAADAHYAEEIDAAKKKEGEAIAAKAAGK
jgi:hypothetical protein